MNITFAFLESLRLETSPKSLSKKQLRESKHHTQGVDQWKLRRADILALIYTYSKLPTSKNSEAFSKPQALYALFFFSFFFSFFIFKTVRCVWVKRTWTNTLLIFALLGTASSLKTFHMPLHSTKRKTRKRRRLSAI